MHLEIAMDRQTRWWLINHLCQRLVKVQRVRFLTVSIDFQLTKRYPVLSSCTSKPAKRIKDPELKYWILMSSNRRLQRNLQRSARISLKPHSNQSNRLTTTFDNRFYCHANHTAIVMAIVNQAICMTNDLYTAIDAVCAIPEPFEN